MAYKIQTSRTKAFLVQDFMPLALVSIGIVAAGFMAYLHVANSGESCGLRAYRICSPWVGLGVMLPIAILLIVVMGIMIINLFRIGTIAKINLKYRDFSDGK